MSTSRRVCPIAEVAATASRDGQRRRDRGAWRRPGWLWGCLVYLVYRVCLVCLVFATAGLACSALSSGDADPLGPAPAPPFALVRFETPLGDGMAQPLNPTLVLTFSDFPDPDTVTFPSLRLGPRGQALEYLLEINLVQRQLRLQPKRLLLPETDYFVDVTTDVRALSGRPLAATPQLRFHTGAAVLPPPMAEPPIHLADVLGALSPPATTGLRAACARSGCHAGADTAPRGLDFTVDDAQLLRQLTTSAPSDAGERLLYVRPGQPERSYLLRKLLLDDGFTRAAGERMPPPPLPALDTATLLQLQRWIRAGAPL